MYSNNILNCQESTTILNVCTKKVCKLIEGATYVLFVPIFWYKIALLRSDPVIRLSTCIFSPTYCKNFLSLLRNVLFCLNCFIPSWYLFSLPSFTSIFWFYSSNCIVVLLVVLFFSFRPNIFQHFSIVLSFLLVVVDFLSAFPIEFTIQVFNFWSSSFEENRFYHRLISLLHRLFHLIPWCCKLRYVVIICLFFSVSTLTVFQSWFLRDVNVIFFSDIIITSTLICLHMLVCVLWCLDAFQFG